MIKRNLNFLKMVKRTVDYLNFYKIYWQDNFALVAIIKLILELKTKIDFYQTEQQLIITGFSKEKKDQKKKVVTNIDILTGSLLAFASTTNNKVLIDKVKHPISDIWRLRDMEFDIFAKTVISLSTTHISDLAEYNITQDNIDKYTSELALYNEIKAKPDQAIKKRKATTESINLTMREFREVINDRMDGIMKQYKVTQPDFYLEYTKQREIINTPTLRLALKGIVTNTETKEPISNVEITIPELEKIAETTKLGNYQFKNIKRGIYKVEFLREGYKSQTIKVEIQESNTTELNISLERA